MEDSNIGLALQCVDPLRETTSPWHADVDCRASEEQRHLLAHLMAAPIEAVIAAQRLWQDACALAKPKHTSECAATVTHVDHGTCAVVAKDVTTAAAAAASAASAAAAAAAPDVDPTRDPLYRRRTRTAARIFRTKPPKCSVGIERAPAKVESESALASGSPTSAARPQPPAPRRPCAQRTAHSEASAASGAIAGHRPRASARTRTRPKPGDGRHHRHRRLRPQNLRVARAAQRPARPSNRRPPSSLPPPASAPTVSPAHERPRPQLRTLHGQGARAGAGISQRYAPNVAAMLQCVLSAVATVEGVPGATLKPKPKPTMKAGLGTETAYNVLQASSQRAVRAAWAGPGPKMPAVAGARARLPCSALSRDEKFGRVGGDAQRWWKRLVRRRMRELRRGEEEGAAKMIQSLMRAKWKWRRTREKARAHKSDLAAVKLHARQQHNQSTKSR